MRPMNPKVEENCAIWTSVTNFFHLGRAPSEH
uniref:Uncharacterized protein n=1 Tax=Rhizophora mucronata TaxID=61149 RepID=A0A2P2QZY5_RHIMU